MIALAAMLGMIACSKVPDNVLPERKMKEVMIDMYLAEGMINTDSKSFPDSLAKDALYQSVFRKHKIKQSLYDSSLVWYGKNLDILMQVNELALKDINDRIRDLGDVQASAGPVSNRDSLNVWPRRDFLVFAPNTLFNGVVYDIKPERPYSSGSGFVLGMRVWGITKKMSHTPELRLSIDQGDTTLVANKKITADGYYQTIIKGVATKQVRRVYGYIRMDNKEQDYYKIYVDSLKLMKYNYRSPALEADSLVTE